MCMLWGWLVWMAAWAMQQMHGLVRQHKSVTRSRLFRRMTEECASRVMLGPRPSRTIVSTPLVGFLDMSVSECKGWNTILLMTELIQIRTLTILLFAADRQKLRVIWPSSSETCISLTFMDKSGELAFTFCSSHKELVAMLEQRWYFFPKKKRKKGKEKGKRKKEKRKKEKEKEKRKEQLEIVKDLTLRVKTLRIVEDLHPETHITQKHVTNFWNKKVSGSNSNLSITISVTFDGKVALTWWWERGGGGVGVCVWREEGGSGVWGWRGVCVGRGEGSGGKAAWPSGPLNGHRVTLVTLKTFCPLWAQSLQGLCI